ncbi:MAG: YraN family protein [Undibacterium sp.]|nr:YraN family protein [Undibacterium sp.]
MTESNWLAKRWSSFRTDRQRIGDEGEEQALLHLSEHGLRLVERNFLCKGGEIDLIMRDQNYLVFVEVRKRQNGDYGGALASITWAKQKRLVFAAQVYLKQCKPIPPCRFDVVCIQDEQVQWLKNVIDS